MSPNNGSHHARLVGLSSEILRLREVNHKIAESLRSIEAALGQSDIQAAKQVLVDLKQSGLIAQEHPTEVRLGRIPELILGCKTRHRTDR
jgi:hypothetical protein